jgi:dTDP-4-dehydrorhamnose 3,5-epimerase
MKFSSRSNIHDVKIIVTNKESDDRGFLVKTFDREDISNILSCKFSLNYVHETYSIKDVLRGIHYQVKRPQNKLLRVVYGSIYNVVLDLRKSSPTFGKWQAELLNSNNSDILWIPAGVAHAYLVISEFAIVYIQSDVKYEADLQRTIKWNDKDLAIDWPLYEHYPIIIPPILSSKDQSDCSFIDAEYFD